MKIDKNYERNGPFVFGTVTVDSGDDDGFPTSPTYVSFTKKGMERKLDRAAKKKEK